ncbi:hypothetical protein [Paenarthrobacter nicotinovorans]|uniref:hypothetical protein n=1 Tax=Paenarthrobacter nicotinovorans TaxID=29320 RepID=UPI0011A5A2C4|nr:hypothetical protein [Paenarthrobacter nicotinovorans]
MHDALAKGRVEAWWELPSTRLLDSHRAILEDTIKKLGRKFASPTPGQIVAALPLASGPASWTKAFRETRY